MSIAVLQDLHSNFERRLSQFGRVCVAGGAVRDVLMRVEPKDFDLFVLHDQGVQFDQLKEQIKERISDLSEIEPRVEWHKSEPFLVATVSWYGREVQVLANPAASVEALVDSFDWNVCLFAYDGEFLCKEDVLNITAGKELKLNKVTYPVSTLRRGFRFSERFLMKFRREDIVKLCEQIAAKKKKAEPNAKAEAAATLSE